MTSDRWSTKKTTDPGHIALSIPWILLTLKMVGLVTCYYNKGRTRNPEKKGDRYIKFQVKMNRVLNEKDKRGHDSYWILPFSACPRASHAVSAQFSRQLRPLSLTQLSTLPWRQFERHVVWPGSNFLFFFFSFQVSSCSSYNFSSSGIPLKFVVHFLKNRV